VAAWLARTYARVPEPCQICGHRPAIRGSRLCARHQQRWKKARRKAGSPGFEEWLAAQVPYDSFGGCRVDVCPELAYSPLGLCHGHESAYCLQGSPGGARLPDVWFGRFEQADQPVPVCYDNEAGFGRWCRAALPLPRPGTVNLRGLAALARAEIQWGLHAHAQAAEHAGWSLGWVQAIADACRGLGCVADLDTSQFDHTVRNAMTEMLAALRLVYLTPAETREAGYLEFGHFGAESGSRRGRFDLTAIPQRWLRDLLWDYTAAQLRSPQAPRSRGSYHNARQACVTLSGFLEARAPGGGHQPGLLGEEHAHAFAADLRHRAVNGLPALGLSRADGKPSLISDRSRNTILNYIRKILRHALDTGDADRIGLDRGFIVALPHGGPMTQRTRRPFTDETARALADPGNLARLAGTFDPSDRGIRDIWETIIATGRRCSEITSLRLDCVGRYGGLPLLWHDQAKVGNYDEAIRIPEYIYQRITERQHKTLDRFEHHHGRPPDSAERARLALFPSPVRNLNGTRTISYHTFQSRFRQWVDQLDLGVSCVAHQARHTLATRLLAHGAGLHHIRRYLGHDKIGTTLGYYRVSEKRVRVAIDRVSGHQFDSQGRRVFLDIRGLLADEHARMRVGQVAVPFGICTEPSNVKAGGQACPYKFTCLGCGHFRSDPSYLPELKSYLQQLLADRERVQAATDLQDWAKAQLTPREEESTRLRELIRRIEADLGELTEHDQALIHDAVTVIRKTRRLVNLGMPSIRPAASTG
jgi:integrase